MGFYFILLFFWFTVSCSNDFLLKVMLVQGKTKMLTWLKPDFYAPTVAGFQVYRIQPPGYPVNLKRQFWCNCFSVLLTCVLSNLYSSYIQKTPCVSKNGKIPPIPTPPPQKKKNHALDKTPILFYFPQCTAPLHNMLRGMSRGKRTAASQAQFC